MTGLRVEVKACSSCGAGVVWCRHADTDRPMPMDAAQALPGAPGAFVVRRTRMGAVTYSPDEAVARRAVECQESEADARAFLLAHGEWRVSHFATCPDAAKHRRPR